MANTKNVGRKSVMNKAVLRKLREAFLFGATDKEACIYAEIAESTLYEYQANNKQFSEQKSAWKLNPIMKAKRTLFDNLNNIKVALWFLERKAPKEFSLKYYSPHANEETAEMPEGDRKRVMELLRDLGE